MATTSRVSDEPNVASFQIAAGEKEIDTLLLLLSLHQQADQLREAIKSYRRLAL